MNPIDPRVAANADLSEKEKTEARGGFILAWKTDSLPAEIQGPWTDYHGTVQPLVDKSGAIVRFADMPPGGRSPMHQTHSLDFGLVVQGEVVLELDDGVQEVVKQGELVVQRGTIHAWINKSDDWNRIMFVMLPAKT